MDNPYQAPSSRIEEPQSNEVQLAGRGARFGAALLDALIMMAVLIPLEFAAGFYQMAMEMARSGQRVPLGTSLLWMLVGFVIFALIQGYPLTKDAQTWGKKVCSIKIASVNGGPPSIQQLAIRYGVYLALGAIPIIGPFVSIINVLLIFRGDRRCGHDLAAGTRVVNV